MVSLALLWGAKIVQTKCKRASNLPFFFHSLRFEAGRTAVFRTLYGNCQLPLANFLQEMSQLSKLSSQQFQQPSQLFLLSAAIKSTYPPRNSRRKLAVCVFFLLLHAMSDF